MLIGAFNIKVFAILLGPVGVGFIGVYQNIVGVASVLIGCGISKSGVRQLVIESDDVEMFSIVRRALLLGSILLGFMGSVCVWLMRGPISMLVFGDVEHTRSVGWLCLGIFFTVVSASQAALFQGLRRLGDISKVAIISALLSSTLGISAVFILKDQGILWFVVIAPAASALVAYYLAVRIPTSPLPISWDSIRRQWVIMLKVGLPLMAAALVTLVTQLIVRSLIIRDLGLEAGGYFQAAWSISITYTGFFLGAMSTDYYPRLAKVIRDPQSAKKTIDEQVEMVLLIATPAITLMIGLAPWVIHLLYSDSFNQSLGVLRWQALGDILKVACFPMGFILVALGRGGLTLLAEVFWSAAYIFSVWISAPTHGVAAAGIGFFIAYAVLYAYVTISAWKLLKFRFSNWILIYLGVSIITNFIIVLSSSYLSQNSIALLSFLMALILGGYSLFRLQNLLNLRGLFKAWLNR